MVSAGTQILGATRDCTLSPQLSGIDYSIDTQSTRQLRIGREERALFATFFEISSYFESIPPHRLGYT